MYVIGFIGGGNMASAIIGGICRAGKIKPRDIAVYDIDPEKQKNFEKTGLNLLSSPREVASSCRYILLAVKPQQMESVLKEISSSLTGDQVIISIAAGISSAYIRSKTREDQKVILVMPNTPLMLGYGASAVAKAFPATDAELNFVVDIFASAGIVEKIAEEQIHTIIPLNGSSPAFIYYYTQLFVAEAAKRGIDPEVANKLFCQSLIGAAHMMTETGLSHQELIDMVCSPKGTTLAGMAALREHHLDEAVQAATEATVRRAGELGQ